MKLETNVSFLNMLQGVKAVIAESYEKMHKGHLIGIGIAPLQFLSGENASVLGLTGKEQFSISFPQELFPGMTLDVKVSLKLIWTYLFQVHTVRSAM